MKNTPRIGFNHTSGCIGCRHFSKTKKIKEQIMFYKGYPAEFSGICLIRDPKNRFIVGKRHGISCQFWLDPVPDYIKKWKEKII